MIPLLRRRAAALLVPALLAFAPATQAEEPPPTTLPPRPISDSVDRVVKRLEEEREAPCRKAIDAGIPCFSATTEARGPEFSVRESLRTFGRGSGPSPSRPPTKDELGRFRPGPVGVVAPLVTVDPGCVAKSLLKSLKGRNDVYYLYRVRDAHGERIVLQDQRLNAATYQGALEFLGRYEGECEAVAAYRREERRSSPSERKTTTQAP